MTFRWPGTRTRSEREGGAGALPALRSRRLRVAASIGALALTVSTLAATALVAGSPADAAPGNPGVPSAGSVVYAEDFQNAPGNPPQLLSAYTGASGQRYTANNAWLTGCNGQVLNFNATAQGNCASANSFEHVRQLAWVLGSYNGSATPATNNAVTAYTEGNPGANLSEFETTTNIPLASSSGRYLTFSVDTAAQNCQVSAPQYQFSFLNAGGAATPVGGLINACTSTRVINAPAVGNTPAFASNVGTYTSNGSVLLTGSSVGIRMANANGSGGGNDAAFDNIRILDVTPQLDKSFSPPVVPTGGTSTLTFTVTNTSELAAKAGWGLTDALPEGLTVAAGSIGGTCNATTTAAPGATSIAVTNGNLAAGQASCTITVPVTSGTTGSYTNGPDNVTPSGLNEPGTSTVTFERPALSLVKRAGAPVDVNANGLTDAGDTIQYTFDVTNSGDVAATDVAVDDAKVGAVTCPSPTLAVGATETCSADAVYTVTAADVTAGSVDNTATATGTSPTGAPITSTPSTTTTPVTAPAPGISIVKSADPASGTLEVGQEVTYNFVVTNTGNVALSDVAVNEGAFSGTGTLSAVDCPATTLAAGSQMVCDATYTLTTADVDAGTVTNNATASGTPAGGTTPITSTPTEVTVPTPAAPGIAVVKSASPATVSAAGQTVTYSFRVTNTGNVTLTDVAPVEGEFSGTGALSDITCPTTTLVAGQVTTCTATYEVTQADVDSGALTNTATAEGTPPAGDPVESTPSNSTVDVPRTPGLSLVKSSDVEGAEVGQVVTYSFLVTNTGNVTIADPTVTDTDFSGAGDLSAIACPTGPLSPGDDITCTATYTATQADVNAGRITNTASVVGTPPSGTDPLDPTPSNEVTVTTDPLPALSLVKTADVDRVTTVGQVVTYSFLVTNTGNVDVTDPSVAEGAFSGHGTLSAVTCPTGADTVAPGDSVICTANYTVVAADLADGGKLTNTATATGTTPTGEPIGSTPSTATVEEVTPTGPGTPAPTDDPTPGVTPGPVAGGTTPGGLAFTGTELVGPGIGLALLLLALGGGLLVIRRRQRGTGQQDAS